MRRYAKVVCKQSGQLSSVKCIGKFCKSPIVWYRGADKPLARPTSRYILFDGENILFDASLVIYMYKEY